MKELCVKLIIYKSCRRVFRGKHFEKVLEMNAAVFYKLSNLLSFSPCSHKFQGSSCIVRSNTGANLVAMLFYVYVS